MVKLSLDSRCMKILCFFDCSVFVLDTAWRVPVLRTQVWNWEMLPLLTETAIF